MQASALTTWLMPASLMVVMFGIGLSLTGGDFRRVVFAPRALVVGLIGQLLWLPALGLLVICLFGLKGELAVGIVLLVACAGGAVSNALTHLARADTALSVALTSIALPWSSLSIPLLTGWAIERFAGDQSQVALPLLATIGRMGATIWLPLAAGMLARRLAPRLADVLERPIRMFAALFLGTLLFAGLAMERDRLPAALEQVGPAVVTLNAAAFASGMLLAALAGLNRRERVAISIEVGIQNSATALFVALSLLERPIISVPAALYTVSAFVFVGVLIVGLRARDWLASSGARRCLS